MEQICYLEDFPDRFKTQLKVKIYNVHVLYEPVKQNLNFATVAFNCMDFYKNILYIAHCNYFFIIYR